MMKMKRKAALADRMREIRLDLYGEDGLENLTRALEVPAQTWRNYERGITMPAELMIEFLVLTGVDPNWLLTGEGDRLCAAVHSFEPWTVRQSDAGWTRQ
jgi:hypothetical protein